MKRKIEISLIFEADANNEEQYMKFLHHSLSELGKPFDCIASRIFVSSIEKIESK